MLPHWRFNGGNLGSGGCFRWRSKLARVTPQAVALAVAQTLAQALAFATVLAPPVAGQGEERLVQPTDEFEVPAGLKVELFAESPQLYNPTAPTRASP